MNHTRQPLRAFSAALRSATGSIDLAAVIIGVIVLSVAGGVAVAYSVAVVPWSQDSTVRSALTNISVAERGRMVGHNSFVDYNTLVGSGAITPGAPVQVAVDASGSCYAAIGTSATGTIFYSTSDAITPTVTKPASLTNWTVGKLLFDKCTADAPLPVVVPATVPDWRKLAVAGNAQTLITNVGVNVNAPGQFCVSVSLTGTASTAAPWSVLFNTSYPPYYGATKTLWSSDSVNFTQRSTPSWRVLGQGAGPSNKNAWNNTWNNAWTSNAAPYTFNVCDSSAPAPPDRPEAYSTAVVKSAATGEWGGKKDCMVATVTGNGVYPFYFGWAEIIDMSSARTDFTSRGVTPTSMSWSPNNSSGQSVTPTTVPTPGATKYTVTSGLTNSVMGSGSTNFTLCLNGA